MPDASSALQSAFIGGFRSGTTLLINLLGLHPGVAPWFETKELCEALRWQHVLRARETAEFETAYCIPSEPRGFDAEAVHERMLWHVRDTHARIHGERASGKAAHERYPLGNDYVRYSLQEAEAALAEWRQASAGGEHAQVAAATGALIRTLGARQEALHGRGRWINKTPEISRFAADLRESLGPCRIVYMVRDGMQVVASGHRLKWGSIEALAFNWKGLLERTRAAMREHAQDYLELRYEDLILQPVATLDRVFAFCGLEPCGTAIVEEFGARFGQRAFDASRLRERLEPAHLRVFREVAGDMQAELGYSLD